MGRRRRGTLRQAPRHFRQQRPDPRGLVGPARDVQVTGDAGQRDFAGMDDHGDPPDGLIPALFAAEPMPIHPGHAQVQHDEVEARVGPQDAKGLFAAWDGRRRVALSFQAPLDDAAMLWAVVDDENAFPCHIRCGLDADGVAARGDHVPGR